MNNDYYMVLGVPPSASQDEIKCRFRFLSQAYHPDKFATDAHKRTAEEEFRRVNTAYRVLSSPVGRARHDATRLEGQAQASHPSPQPMSGTPSSAPSSKPPTTGSHHSGGCMVGLSEMAIPALCSPFLVAFSLIPLLWIGRSPLSVVYSAVLNGFAIVCSNEAIKMIHQSPGHIRGTATARTSRLLAYLMITIDILLLLQKSLTGILVR